MRVLSRCSRKAAVPFNLPQEVRDSGKAGHPLPLERLSESTQQTQERGPAHLAVVTEGAWLEVTNRAAAAGGRHVQPTTWRDLMSQSLRSSSLP